MPKGQEAELYQRGLRDFQAGNLSRAELVFSEFVDTFPASDLADNALYQLGMIYSMTSRKAKALETFQLCVEAYAGTDAAPMAAEQVQALEGEIAEDDDGAARSLFFQGRDLAAKGQFGKAKEIFLKCVEDYPTSTFADNVYLSLSVVYSLEEQFSEARRALELILEKFPGSDAASMVPAALKQLERDERFA
jgi:TolA-binding protein